MDYPSAGQMLQRLVPCLAAIVWLSASSAHVSCAPAALGLWAAGTAIFPPDRVQLLCGVAGLVLYLALVSWRQGHSAKVSAAAATVLAAACLVLGSNAYGARSRIELGTLSFQPLELAKPFFCAAAADKTHVGGVRRPLFTALAVFCVGVSAAVNDFGAALVYFLSYLAGIFAASRRWEQPIAAAVCGAFASALVCCRVPHLARRISMWGRANLDPLGGGWQQCLAMSAAASGGLLGLGVGNGSLRRVFAADTDLVFCAAAQELGLVCALCLAGGVMLMSARGAQRGVAAASASAMLTSMVALNVLGSLDLLPFTGVTFPFLSRGGSSLFSCWLLTAFIDRGRCNE